MEFYKQLVETIYTEPNEEEILGTFLQLENTGEQDLAPVTLKQKKKPKYPPESVIKSVKANFDFFIRKEVFSPWL